jgi:hypothetical protein
MGVNRSCRVCKFLPDWFAKSCSLGGGPLFDFANPGVSERTVRLITVAN